MNSSMTLEVGLGKLMKTTSYMTSPTGKSVVCELVLHNGFVLHGTALIVDNDVGLANRKAFNSAKSKLMELESYATHDRMHRSVPSRNQVETEEGI